jgi:hypothetical protein
MLCIYCLKDSSNAKSLPHVVPEAITKNGVTLPRGAVCDDCNHYLGHELDSALLNHPVVAMLVQLLGTPGKRGRPREVAGNVKRDEIKRELVIPCAAPETVTDAQGRRSQKVKPLVDPSFNLLRFRRALHHVAFNAVALRDGVERVLDARYDPVRRYVRRPHKGESWPYLQHFDFDRGVARDVTTVILREPETEYVAFIVGKTMTFGVDLRNPGTRDEIRRTEFPEGTELVGSRAAVPRADCKPGATRYRLVIPLDE